MRRCARLRAAFGLALGGGAALTGCVDRRFVVDSNVPGAQISVDGVPIGPSPADKPFVYAGGYEFRAVAPGYQPLTKIVKLRPKWHDYPGLDFFAECVYPGRIEDVRHVELQLKPAEPPRVDDITARADEMRARGATLPPATVPDDPKPAPAAVPLTPPAVLPPGPRVGPPDADPLVPPVPPTGLRTYGQ